MVCKQCERLDFLMLFSSVTQSCPTLCNPMDCSTPGFPVHHQLPSLLKLMSIKLVMPSNHLILCRPLFLPPSIFPSIRVFPKESALHIRWPKYWSFSYSISASNESILKEISPGCTLEGVMLKLNLQYFGHLMQRADSFEKTLMLGKIEDRRRRG